MSDTVSGTAIAGSLDADRWTFLPVPDAPPSSGALHVNGAAHTGAAAPGLLVEFRTLSLDLQLVPLGAPLPDAPPSAAGAYAALPPDTQPRIVAGALQQAG